MWGTLGWITSSCAQQMTKPRSRFLGVLIYTPPPASLCICTQPHSWAIYFCVCTSWAVPFLPHTVQWPARAGESTLLSVAWAVACARKPFLAHVQVNGREFGFYIQRGDGVCAFVCVCVCVQWGGAGIQFKWSVQHWILAGWNQHLDNPTPPDAHPHPHAHRKAQYCAYCYLLTYLTAGKYTWNFAKISSAPFLPPTWPITTVFSANLKKKLRVIGNWVSEWVSEWTSGLVGEVNETIGA